MLCGYGCGSEVTKIVPGFGDKIRRLRLKKGYCQKDFAKESKYVIINYKRIMQKR